MDQKHYSEDETLSEDDFEEQDDKGSVFNWKEFESVSVDPFSSPQEEEENQQLGSKKKRQRKMTGIDLPSELIHRLIARVEEHPNLWDLRALDAYKDRAMRESSWAAIAGELNLDKDVAMVKWGLLRQQFRNALSKVMETAKSRSQKAAIRRRPANDFYNAMRFMEPIMAMDNSPYRKKKKKSSSSLTATAKTVSPVAAAPKSTAKDDQSIDADDVLQLQTEEGFMSPPKRRLISQDTNEATRYDELIRKSTATIIAKIGALAQTSPPPPKRTTYGKLIGERFDAMESNGSIRRRDINAFKSTVDLLLNRIEGGQHMPPLRNFLDMLDTFDNV